jgi:putative protease
MVMRKPELLAPVGNTENFFAAIEAGADAVYVGAPGFNARNLARDLTLEEIGAMIEYCHARERKLYIAANSLILEDELAPVIKNLALIQELEPDGLIVQDLGIINLVNHYFPHLRLRSSTLMTAHNSDSVRFLASLGIENVVLSRELTLKEIAAISARCGDIQLEVFVHGAMCFSYSGLCLFSSYLGGKSGLRGKCVQPCRRAYTPLTKSKKGSGKKRSGGYIFSMNDLCGFEALPELRNAGVSSFKIEGRLRSAHYVKHIVQAYRTVLDCSEENRENALAEASLLADQAMSRKVTSGYFFSPQPAEAITPYHSGNMGTHLGRFSAVKMVGNEHVCRFTLKADLAVGDRIRLHMEPSGERVAFRLKKLFVVGEEQSQAHGGQKVSLTIPHKAAEITGGHVEVYKVDGGVSRNAGKKSRLEINSFREKLSSLTQQLSGKVDAVCLDVCRGAFEKETRALEKRRIGKKQKVGKPSLRDIPLDWWLKTDSIKSVQGQLPFSPDRFLLSFEKQLVSQAGVIKRYLGRNVRKVIWALPPLIMENDLARCRKQIKLLVRSGYRDFQLGHISQVELFSDRKVRLFADYTMNLMNSSALNMARETGFDCAQLAIEMDKEALLDTVAGHRAQEKNFPLGLTVYGAPALYTSRLLPSGFQYEKPVMSPRQEPFITRKKEGFIQTFPQKPFSLLPWLNELKEMRFDYVVVDITGGNTGKRDILELKERLMNSGKYGKLSTFNYFGKLG